MFDENNFVNGENHNQSGGEPVREPRCEGARYSFDDSIFSPVDKTSEPVREAPKSYYVGSGENPVQGGSFNYSASPYSQGQYGASSYGQGAYNGGANAYGAQNSAHPETTPRPSYGKNAGYYEVCTKPHKKSKGRGKLAALIAVCLVVSCVAGAVCGYFTKNVSSVSGGSSNQTGGSVVVYQNVDGDSSSLSLNSGLTVSDIANKVMDSVVEITTEIVQSGSFLSQYVTTGAGSGVIISDDGYIVTNNHVIESATSVTVTLNNGESYPATLIGTDATTDIAVIKIEVTSLKPAVFGSSDNLNVGDYAMAVGNPLGKLGGTVTDGIISALARKVTIDGTDMTLLQTNAAINPGNSGGGLFNSDGELIGIVNAKAAGSDIEGLGFAIPIDTAKPIIEDLLQNGYVTGRVHAGITILDILDYTTAFQYRVSNLGPYIYSVESGSDAEKAGIKPGDLVVSVKGTNVSSSSEIANIITSCEVGETIKIVVIRNSQEMTIDLTFSEYKPTNTMN